MSIIGITMGCPAGIGPEIIYKYFAATEFDAGRRAVVLGDLNVLRECVNFIDGPRPDIVAWRPGAPVPEPSKKVIPVLTLSSLKSADIVWGKPNLATAKAMASYITEGVRLATDGILDGIATAPISKYALNEAGFSYPGHTEMLADLTSTKHYAMMMAGETLRVTLVTIHCAISDVPQLLTRNAITEMIETTNRALHIDFGIEIPRIGVAALNPHGGENRMFGLEEETTIIPAIEEARKDGINVEGPFPPDTIFHKAANDGFDAVVCMYHDQGLIPFKLLHFSDGVNVTLGLPIVRTSVDHGTAYDIAGKGIADPSSLHYAVHLAHSIAENRMAFAGGHSNG